MSAMQVVQGLFGIAVFCVLAWLFSSHRRTVPWRIVLGGLSMQFVLAWLVIDSVGGRRIFKAAADFVTKLLSMNEPGAAFVFGPLAKYSAMEGVFGSDGAFIFAFAGTGLVAIIFFSALMSVLYHLGVIQFVVWVLARSMSKILGVSGAESMAMAANIFVGQTEAPLVVKPYLAKMTNSELNALMTGGFATLAGSVLAVYMGIIGSEVGPHLLTASVMSAPAAFVVAKLMQPETEVSPTSGALKLRIERDSCNLIEAATNGTQDGLKLWLNVIAMLIAFIALVNFVNWPLGAIGESFGMAPGELSLSLLFGKLLAPLAWCMGVEGWHDCELFGSLLGTKIAINEFVAFKDLVTYFPPELLSNAADASSSGVAAAASSSDAVRHTVFEHARSAEMAAYALCGFANFASVGIQIGGISPLAPDRKLDLSRLAMRAMLGGAFASWMTATVAGIFL
ncbi:MAG: NupC/NupG family nucleoside CNT transporter [Planctomycetes bacterium]|nr:NupC/NupG family nucleoside CNT transporter [Planctomycetota bacterium]MCB9905987.1 NupC/NupG family nucleoside CNT transporter [Planctomycetota bacterium]